MNKRFFTLILTLILITPHVQAEKTSLKLRSTVTNPRDKASLQRGARYFMNYCAACHSLKYMRYERMAKDIGLTTFQGEVDRDLLYNNLIFTQAKMHEPIHVAMPPASARQWFGIVPPDLSLTARSRGSDWIYTYLHSFYVDENRPFGANNLLVPDVAMPNVLAPLQGTIIKKLDKDNDIISLRRQREGRMSQHAFDSMVKDIVNFLDYVAEPVKVYRQHLGIYVLLFLLVFWGVAYRLKKAYWKDILH